MLGCDGLRYYIFLEYYHGNWLKRILENCASAGGMGLSAGFDNIFP